MLQALANHLVCSQQVGRRNALTVGRVGYHDALLLGLGEHLEVLLRDGNIASQTSSLYIQARRVHGLDVDVVTIDVVLEFALLRVVVVNLVKQVGVEVGPLLEGKLLAEQAWSHVAGYQRSLDEQRTASAHGVNEIRLARPARHQNHTCGQHLVQRGLDALLTIAATMQRLAARVERQRAFTLSGGHVGNVDVQTHVGIGYTDVRTVARLFAELVDNGVLHLVGYEFRVAEFFREYHRVDGKGLVQCQILCPVDILHTLVDVVCRQGLEVFDGFQNTDGRMQLEISAIHQLLIARKGHHSASYRYILSAQLRQFVRQDRFQSHKGLGDHFKCLCHDVYI